MDFEGQKSCQVLFAIKSVFFTGRVGEGHAGQDSRQRIKKPQSGGKKKNFRKNAKKAGTIYPLIIRKNAPPIKSNT